MIDEFLTNGLVGFISSIFLVIGYFVMMMITNFTLSLIVVFGVPVLIIASMILVKNVRNAFRKNQAVLGKLNANIQESVSGIRVIKTFNREKSEFDKFEKINRESRDVSVRAELLSCSFFPIMSTMNSVLLAFVIGFGGMLAFNRLVRIGVIISFIIYVRRFMEPLRQISRVYSMMLSALAGAERIFRLVDTKSDILDKSSAVTLDKLGDKVIFEDVSFSYEEGKTVLNGINLEVNKGDVVALACSTGAGKTTIINLLMRFYDVNSGKITIDGVDIRDIKLKSLRRLMGIVLQESFFFASSIRENLLYGKPNSGDEHMIESSKLARADHFIKKLPRGCDTELSERGMNLSQGERQLLAIARVIISDPQILILDEATSNVDSVTESYIQEGLLELMKGRTSFIIAHRLSTIKRADKVIVIHNHKIMEEGTHESLMEGGGFYSRLYNLQINKDCLTSLKICLTSLKIWIFEDMSNLTEDMDI